MAERKNNDREAGLISIVVPFHDEAPGVAVFHRELCAALETVPGYRFELICVDDGSRDETLARLLELVARDPRLRVIELSRNFGKEAALTAGIDAALGDSVIVMDADLQDPPALIGRFVEEWRRGADVVQARRIDRSSDSFLKRSTARLFYRLHNRLSSVKIPDNVGDFRLLDRKAVDALKTLPERQRFMKGLFAWIGFRTATVDYARAPRAAGATKFSGWRLWNLALEGFTSFSTVPLRIWTYLGAVGALLTFLYAVFIIARVLMLGVDVPGYASLLVAVLFLGSLQLLSVGLLGEYIGRMYLETKQRPIYIVRREFGRSDVG
jgi:glycosyltransferase involved in cell wall biosynthesis